MAKVGRAFLTGLSVTAGPPIFQATLDPGKVLESLQSEPEALNETLSFYSAGFTMLQQAATDFTKYGSKRLVVFIDDLDRCLPENALDVLESMKVFFDLEGFVFVVGLDQDIVKRAITAKYGRSVSGEPEIEGLEYIKKLFQVSFTLPPMYVSRLQDYLADVANNADFSDGQRQDFDVNVRRHLAYLSGADSINPREIKRLINTYVLQLKTLSRRLSELNPDVVLALQVMAFRPDWLGVYEHLVADPDQFQRAVADAVMESKTSAWISGIKVLLPDDLVRYLENDASSLLTTSKLSSYVSAAESTRSIDPSLLESQSLLGHVRRLIDEAPDETGLRDLVPALTGDVRRLLDITRRRSSVLGSDLEALVGQLDGVVRELGFRTLPIDEDREEWTGRILKILNSIDGVLRELRRRANVGASND